MGVFKSIVANLGASENKPVVRVRGLFRWSRRLTVFVPGAVKPNIWSTPLLEDTAYKFSISDPVEGVVSVLNGHSVVSMHKSREEAAEMLELIANAIAPSKWRYVRRFLAAWLVIYIFFPGQDKQVHQSQPDSAPRPMASAPYVAPQAERPMFVAPAQIAPAERPAVMQVPETAANDPFGLQLTPEGK